MHISTGFKPSSDVGYCSLPLGEGWGEGVTPVALFILEAASTFPCMVIKEHSTN